MSQRLGSNLVPIGSVPPGEAKPQEPTVLRLIHGALALIHLQLETTRNKPAEAGHHPFTCSPAPHLDIAIISVAAESVPSGLKRLIQLVQPDIGKKRRSGEPCWCTRLRYRDQPAFRKSGRSSTLMPATPGLPLWPGPVGARPACCDARPPPPSRAH
jgi:hypothetical protein